MDRHADIYVRDLSRDFPDVEFLGGEEPSAVMQHLPKAQVLMGLAPFITPQMIAAAGQLEWVQALTTGVDNLLAMPELKADVLLTNTRGIHGPQMSEMAFLYMLALARDWRVMHMNQTGRVWQRRPQKLLWRRTLTIIGLGAIAEDLARRAKAFDMEVIGVTNQPRPVPGFDKVVSRGKLAQAMGQADFVVILAPYSSDTHHMIDAAAISAMRPDAYLINLGRGSVVDEAALLAALDASAIAGAGLDVFAVEPLPPESPWWSHEKVLLTPHVGGMSDVYENQVLPIVEANLTAFLSGRPDQLQNRVTR